MKAYEVVFQQPQIMSEGGTVVEGFLIRARLIEFDEFVEVKVRRLDPELVDSKIRELLETRRKLADLGEG